MEQDRHTCTYCGLVSLTNVGEPPGDKGECKPWASFVPKSPDGEHRWIRELRDDEKAAHAFRLRIADEIKNAKAAANAVFTEQIAALVERLVDEALPLAERNDND